MTNITLAPVQPDQPTHLMATYGRQAISFVRGRGAYLYTADGTEYLDALTGIAVCGLGHAHPVIAEAIAEQAATLIHTSNLFEIPWQTAAAQKLAEVSGMEEIFFSNSGAESNEGAIKIARKFGAQQGIVNPKILVAEQSFHGRTLATLSATGNKKVQEGFAPLVQGFIRVPFGDVEAIQEAAIHHPDIVAILIEPIQGEGGVNTAPQGFSYLEEVRALCNQHNWLMMLDEIQTGNGRTGKYFAYQHTNIVPDVMTTAKGLGNGFPIGAVMTQGKAVGLLGAGSHGSTYGGTVLGSRVVYTVLDTLEKENAVANAATVGAYIVDQLKAQLAGHNVQVRGFGMMIGIQLPKDCAELVAIARDQYKLIINVTAGSVVRLLPPLNMTQAQADELLQRLVPAIQNFLKA
ncbi:MULTISPECIES: aspartate aminotransferase family protein [unclassified Acinetobacter]|uniref:aspartate aminotransferase family protein n=1 Tax=unclassified Acinetobacter TaxID=196816 RepID=UPI00244BD4F1|nr:MULTISPECIES: aspartate aminotransferase family protein [unclassified Acinetobacter]MDH0033040.1 aspartate aminotransferase family protein [Acinetobacter sp. GD04021]MDH0888400.1 aspartate aminotransferase family protein [Acinetobacter sp. GD03873]MDH1084814.1 aspartate aminotransferase family protein [Acinetobacter sp. GD03983]MDH2191700.1 aspartate aminotransferase family protein [Acinetobacter sp. GD03645]MDH2205321.1 aspartate aminotransferase family protein [Acinetobacter sp. GD03647]